jgi:hypothetical protein
MSINAVNAKSIQVFGRDIRSFGVFAVQMVVGDVSGQHVCCICEDETVLERTRTCDHLFYSLIGFNCGDLV